MMTFLSHLKNQDKSGQSQNWVLAISLMVVSTLLVFLAGSSWSSTSTVNPVIYEASENTVIARTGNAGGVDVSAITEFQRQLRQNPGNVEYAVALGSAALDAFRASGNERFVGVAREALQPWWNDTEPPPQLWLLRADILQNRHHFSAAAQDLTRYSRNHPTETMSVSLQLADAWKRAGEIDLARHACLTTALNGQVLLARYCAADILLTIGLFQEGFESLAGVSDRYQELMSHEPAIQRWALAIEADLLLESNKLDEALLVWERIQRTGKLTLQEKLVYADLLYANGQYKSVLSELKDLPVSIAVLVRRGNALKTLDDQEYLNVDRILEQLMTAQNGSDGRSVHLREQALYSLWFEEDGVQATQLALQNWLQQKGWEDAELVIQASNSVYEEFTSGAVSEMDYLDTVSARNEILQWRKGWVKSIR